MKVVLASGNPGKLKEISSLLVSIDVDLIPQTQLGIEESGEPHDNFLENALAKASHASRA